MSENSIDSRYSDDSARVHCYLEDARYSKSKCESDISYSKARRISKERTEAVLISHANKEAFTTPSKCIETIHQEETVVDHEDAGEVEEEKPERRGRIRDGHFESSQRGCIAHLFKYIFGLPPEKEWVMIITKIMTYLRMPNGSRNVVRNVFKGVLEAEKKGVEYDADKGTSSRRFGKFKISDDCIEAGLICKTLQHGLSITHATVLANESRRARGLDSVSWSCVENWSLRSEFIAKFRRGTKKSGKSDPHLFTI